MIVHAYGMQAEAERKHVERHQRCYETAKKKKKKKKKRGGGREREKKEVFFAWRYAPVSPSRKAAP